MAALQWSRTKIFNDMQVKIAQCDRVRVRVRVCFICHHANQSLFIYLFHTRFFSVRRNKCIHTDGSGSIHAIDAISTCMQLLLNWNSSAAIMILYLVSVHFFLHLALTFSHNLQNVDKKLNTHDIVVRLCVGSFHWIPTVNVQLTYKVHLKPKV